MRYFWKGDGFYDRDGKPMAKPFEGQVCSPSIMSDLPEYRSPVDGKPITSRSHRREDLARNNCVDARDLPSMNGRFRNERFCKKRGLQVAEEYRN